MRRVLSPDKVVQAKSPAHRAVTTRRCLAAVQDLYGHALNIMIVGVAPRTMTSQQSREQSHPAALAGSTGWYSRFWFDQDKGIRPIQIPSPQRGSENPVHTMKPGARLLSYDDGELLPQSSFQYKPGRVTNARTYVTTAMTSEVIALISRAAFDGRNRSGLNPLILLTDQVLMTHSLYSEIAAAAPAVRRQSRS